MTVKLTKSGVNVKTLAMTMMVCGLVYGGGDNTTSSNVEAPGGDTSAKTKALETGTALAPGQASPSK